MEFDEIVTIILLLWIAMLIALPFYAYSRAKRIRGIPPRIVVRSTLKEAGIIVLIFVGFGFGFSPNVGIIAGAIALVFEYVMLTLHTSRRCIYCHARVPEESTVCKHCGKDIGQEWTVG